MNNNTAKAKLLLDSQNYTCVICNDEKVFTSTERGVAPLVNWLRSRFCFQGYSAADKVVGRAAAHLYCLLGVKEVYAHVISDRALQVLATYGIAAEAEIIVEGIINRQGTGPCPLESAVMNIEDPAVAYKTILTKLYP